MTPALKQRVVGAIVLVALAVIFVPMLLDGSGRRSGEQVPVEIPEAPSQPDPAIDTSPGASDADASPSGSAEVTATDDEPGADAQASVESADAAGTSTSSAGEDDPGAGSPGTATTRAGEDEGAADEPEAEAGQGSSDSAWVVQVGSFGRQTNAIVLRDRLREDGHEAFIDTGSTDAGKVWRVRVGPVTERGRAEQLKRELDRAHGLDTLVMAQPG